MASLDYLRNCVLLDRGFKLETRRTVSARILNRFLLSPMDRLCQELPSTFRQLQCEVTQINFLDDPDASNKLAIAIIKTKSAVSDFQRVITADLEKSASFELLFSAASFANMLKRPDVQNPAIWEALDNQQRTLLNRLSPLTQPPNEPAVVRIYLANTTHLTGSPAVEFGDNVLYSTSQGRLIEGNLCFDLPRHPRWVIMKPIQPNFPIEPFLDFRQHLDKSKIGRLGEIFDLQLWECIYNTSLNQILDSDLTNTVQQNEAKFFLMFQFYRQCLVQVLDLPVNMPLDISKTGDWVIASSRIPLKLSEINHSNLSALCIDSIAADIVRHLKIERKYRINLLGNQPDVDLFKMTSWMRCIADSIPELPAFFNRQEDIAKRHEKLIGELKKYPALHSAVRKLYDHFSSNLQENKHVILSQIVEDNALLSARNLCRAHLLQLVEDPDHLANVTYEDVLDYAVLFMNFLQKTSESSLEDKEFRTQLTQGHQQLERKLHNRMMIYLVREIPQMDDWEKIIHFVQNRAEILLDKLSKEIVGKVSWHASNGWNDIQTQFRWQLEAIFMDRLNKSLEELINKTEINAFIEESLTLFASKSIDSIDVENKQNLNIRLIHFLHYHMQEKAKVEFRQSLQTHLDGLQ